MKTKPESHKSKITGVILALLCLTAGSQAQVVIGSWQGSGSEGWIDNGNSLSITDPANTGKYSFASGVVPGYGQSLQISQSGFGNNLEINLASNPTDLTAFLNNHLLSFTFSAPAALPATTAGYMQIYQLIVNAPGYGFHAQPWANATATGNTSFNQSGMPNYYYFPGSPFESQIVTLDYSSILPAIVAGGYSYLQLIFTSNNDSGASGAPTDFWMNNVTLSGGPVPEPSTFALFGIGVAGVLLYRRRK